MARLRAISFDDDQVEQTQVLAPSGLFALVLCLMPLVAVLLSLGIQPPYVFEAAAAGFLWAGVFLVGFAVGGLLRGQVIGTLICGLFCWLATHAFTVISDFVPAESLALSSLNLIAGWICALTTTNNWSSLRLRSESDPTSAFSRPVGRGQFGVWEISFLTVLVAIISSSVQRIESPMSLLACGVAAAVGGLVSSWFASRLAWHDDWKASHVVAFLTAIALVVGLLVLRSPMPAWSTIAWFIAGPASTILAQGTTVLFFCAALRWDLNYRRKMAIAQSH